jgi:hypothetical protein
MSSTEFCVFMPLSPVFVSAELHDNQLWESEYLYEHVWIFPSLRK